MSIQNMNDSQRVLRVVAALLEYPDARWRSRLGEAEAALGEIRDFYALETLRGFLGNVRQCDSHELEQQYVQAFDFGKKTSLNLSVRSSKDERQQRMALLSYSLFYEQAGYTPGEELPDYLPALLELAANVGAEQAARIMQAASGDIELLHAALAEEEALGGYAALVQLVLRAGGQLQHIETEQEVAA